MAIKGFPALIEMISVALSLERGYVIITGTAGGVGAARKPPIFHAARRYLRSGDRRARRPDQPRAGRLRKRAGQELQCQCIAGCGLPASHAGAYKEK